MKQQQCDWRSFCVLFWISLLFCITGSIFIYCMFHKWMLDLTETAQKNPQTVTAKHKQQTNRNSNFYQINYRLQTLRQTDQKIKWTVDDQYIFKNAFVHKHTHVFIYRHENMFIHLKPTESALNHIVVFIDVILQLKFVLEFTYIFTYIHSICVDMLLVNGGETVCEECVMCVCLPLSVPINETGKLISHHDDPAGYR